MSASPTRSTCGRWSRLGVGEPSPWLRRACSAGLAAGLAFLAGCATNPVTGASDFVLMSERAEIEAGERGMAQILETFGGEYRDRRLAAYVAEVGQRLARLSHRPEVPYRFVVVSSPAVNALALGGGPVVITTGILAVLQDEAQMAAVLAHEVGHITARHQVREQARGTVAGLLIGILNVSIRTPQSGSVSLSRLLGGLSLMAYSRGAETEADALAVEYLARAGYEPAAAIRLQEFLLSAEHDRDSGGFLHDLLRSHPLNQERIEATREAVNRLRIEDRLPEHPETGRDRYLRETAALRRSFRQRIMGEPG